VAEDRTLSIIWNEDAWDFDLEGAKQKLEHLFSKFVTRDDFYDKDKDKDLYESMCSRVVDLTPSTAVQGVQCG
jgi:hypothetical protein